MILAISLFDSVRCFENIRHHKTIIKYRTIYVGYITLFYKKKKIIINNTFVR